MIQTFESFNTTFITGIFANFYANGGILTFKTGISGGPDSEQDSDPNARRWRCSSKASCCTVTVVFSFHWRRLHGVPEKEDARLVAVILSKLNRFSKFFHYRLINKCVNKWLIIKDLAMSLSWPCLVKCFGLKLPRLSVSALREENLL